MKIYFKTEKEFSTEAYLQTYRRENSCWKYLKISAAALNAGT